MQCSLKCTISERAEQDVRTGSWCALSAVAELLVYLLIYSLWRPPCGPLVSTSGRWPSKIAGKVKCFEMQTELTTLPLSPLLRSKLVNCGFTVVEDVVGLKPSELSKGKLLSSWFTIAESIRRTGRVRLTRRTVIFYIYTLHTFIEYARWQQCIQ